ncbi:MAG: ferric reductase-like transmembrane domain-containing protein [Pseudomonadota bacterium]
MALALPGLIWTVAYAGQSLSYGQYVHRTGLIALQLVLLALAITPLCRWLPWPKVARWWRRSRRYVGVASFIYAALHVAAYCWRQPWPRVIDEAASFAYGAGWLAALVMALLAITSNDASVRHLGRRWKALHRWVYPATILTLLHWWLTAFAPRVVVPWILVFALVLLARVVPREQGAS